MISHVEMIESFRDYIIFYMRFKGQLMVSDRDFIDISTVNKMNGLTYVVSTSISHDKCPIVKGVTRGDIIVGS